MNEGLISIITPCYNGSRFIKRYVDSIINQTYKKIELIVINDDSPDDSEEILMSYKKAIEDSGINYIYRKQENEGVGGAIAAGLKLMTGEYFTWVDIDDSIMPDYAEKAVAFLKSHKDYGVVRFDGNIVKDSEPDKVIGTMAANNHDKFNPNLFENSLYQRNFHFGYSVVRTECFVKANHGLSIYESRQGQNWQILLPVFYYYKSGYIDECLYTVCEHDDSVSRREVTYPRRIAQIEEYERILEITLSNMHIPNDEKEKYLKSVKERYSHRIFGWAISHYDYSRARHRFKYLQSNDCLSANEKKQYHSRLFQMEYWMYLVARIKKKDINI